MNSRNNNRPNVPEIGYTTAKWLGFFCAYCLFTIILFVVQSKGLSIYALDLPTTFLLTSALVVFAKLIKNILAE